LDCKPDVSCVPSTDIPARSRITRIDVAQIEELVQMSVAEHQ
jgi:hypothetical protein